MTMSDERTGPELVRLYLSEKFQSTPGISVLEKHLLKFEHEVGLRAASTSDGRDVVEAWLSRPGIRKDTTRDTYHSELRSFYGWALAKRLLTIDPTVGVARRNPKKGRPSAISHDDLTRAVKVAGPRMRAWLLLGAIAGCYPKEIAALTPDDVLDRQVSPSLRIRGRKGGNQRIVPLREDVMEALDFEYVTSLDLGVAWETNPQRISQTIATFLKSQKINASANDLRHRYGFDTAEATDDPIETMRRLGHSTLSSALVYFTGEDDETSVPPDEERNSRLELWKQFKDPIGNLADASFLGNAEGLTTDNQGLALSIRLPEGELLEDPVIYRVNVPSELEFLELAQNLNLPVFVMAGMTEVESMDVQLGWIEGINGEAGLALIALREDSVKTTDVGNKPFVLTVPQDERLVVRNVRGGQKRFRFYVYERYGTLCALCDLNLLDLLEAAHIVPWAESGSDDAGNGLLLCPLHHRAFDAGYIAIEPESLIVLPQPSGPSLDYLHVSRTSLSHLSNPPNREALEYAWHRRWCPGRRQDDAFKE